MNTSVHLKSGHVVTRRRHRHHRRPHRHHHDIVSILRSAIGDFTSMTTLRTFCSEFQLQAHRMLDNEVVNYAAHLISVGDLHLFEPTKRIAWGKKVSAAFKDRVITICSELGFDPDFLMAAMAFESAETFRSDIKNAAGSGAVGLIQFMPKTAASFHTSTDDLASLDPVKQLDYVKQYFSHYKNRLTTIEDVYMVILWPAAVGKNNDFVLFDKDDHAHEKRYTQNHGLDVDHDGKITKGEASAGVKKKLERGRSEKFFG